MKTFYIFDYTPIKVEFGGVGGISTMSASGERKDYTSNDLDFGDVRIHLVEDGNDFNKKVIELKGCDAIFLDEEDMGSLHEPSEIALKLVEDWGGHLLCFSHLIVVFKTLTDESLKTLKSYHQEPYAD